MPNNGTVIKPRKPYQCSVGLSEELWREVDTAAQTLLCSRGDVIEHLLRSALGMPTLYSTKQIELYFQNFNK